MNKRVFYVISDMLKLGVLANLADDLVFGDANDLSVLHLLVTLGFTSADDDALASLLVGLES